MQKKSYLLTLFSFLIISNTIFSITNANTSQITNHQDTLEVVISTSQTDATQITSELIDSILQTKIIIVTDTQEKSITAEELGLKVNILNTPSEILNSYRYTNYINKILNKPFTYKMSYNAFLNPNDLEFKIFENLGINESKHEIKFEEGKYKLPNNLVTYKISNLDSLLQQITQSLHLSQIEIKPTILQESNQQIIQQLQLEIDKLNAFQDISLNLSSIDSLFEYNQTIINKDIQINQDGNLELKSDVISSLIQEAKLSEKQVQNLIVNKINEDSTLEVTGDFQNGKTLNTNKLTTDLQNANLNNNINIELDYLLTEAKVINQFSEQNYNLLAVGQSNFSGSDNGRIHNVKYSSDNKYKAIYLKKDEEFSFNKLLGRVTTVNGWRNAYIIQGGEIITAPGGGICQMSTTLYRAALNAGFDISQQFNHSLYVSYYTAHGDGLDSTIFPGSKDLKFINNTPSDVILYSYYTEDNDLFVYVFGEDDGRQVELHGPFYNGNNQDNPFNLTTRTNQINWVRTLNLPNQETKQEVLTSTYSKFYKR